MFSALKSILLLGNVDFESQTLSNSQTFTTTVSDDSLILLDEVATIFGIDVEDLATSFLVRKMTLRGETAEIPFSISGASDARDALCKEIYGRLFKTIVQQANYTLNSSVEMEINDQENHASCIGLLDIFGFEDFPVNSFEQLCINYANEKLQQHFIRFVIKAEEVVYTQEGITFDQINSCDNEGVLTLFEDRKSGILIRLDEELKLPKASDETFLKKLDFELTSKAPNGSYFKDIKMAKHEFEVRHFAGTIRYDTRGFLEKNKDRLYDHFEDLLASSTNSVFRKMMINNPIPTEVIKSSSSQYPSPQPSEKGTNSSSNSISTRFQLQLNQLMSVLAASKSHFIKCIKPNNANRPNDLNKELVLKQLGYSGIIEALQVRRDGFPVRKSHEDFSKTFWVTLPKSSRKEHFSISIRERCELICREFRLRCPSSPKAGFRIEVGATKVLAQSNAIQFLSKERLVILSTSAILLQSVTRLWRIRKRYLAFISIKNNLKTLLNNPLHRDKVELINVLQAALSELKEALKEIKSTHQLSLIFIANSFIDRLMRIQSLNEDIKSFLSIYSEHSQMKISSEMITDDFETAQRILSEANSLQYNSSQDLSKVVVISETIKQYATILAEMKAGVSEANEIVLEKALQRFDLLQDNKIAVMCEEEISSARRLVTQIRHERDLIRKTCQHIFDLQETRKEALSNLSPNSAERVGDGDPSDVLGQKMALLELHTNRIIDSLEGAIVAINDRNEKLTAFSRLVIDILQGLIDLQKSRVSENWTSLGTSIEALLAHRKRIISISTESNGDVTAIIDAVISNETVWTASEINEHYVCPYLTSLMTSFDIDSMNDGVLDELNLAAEKLKQYSFCGSCNTALSMKTDFIIRLCGNLEEKFFLDILYVTAESADNYIRIYGELNKFQESLSAELSVVGDELFAPINEMKTLSVERYLAIIGENQKWRNSEMPQYFEKFNSLLDEQILKMRIQAFRLFAAVLVETILPYRSAIEDDDQLVSSDLSASSIQLLLDFLLSDPLSVWIPNILKGLPLLKQMRSLLRSSNLSGIVHLFEHTEITDSIAESDNEFSTKSSENAIMKEVLIITRFAVRKHAIETILAGIEANLLCGPFGAPKIDKVCVHTLESDWTRFDKCNKQLEQLGRDLPDDVDALMRFTKSYLDIKKILLNEDSNKLNQEDLSQSIMTLKEQFLLLPDHLAQESFEKDINRIYEEVQYKNILKVFRGAISTNENVQYLVARSLSGRATDIVDNETPKTGEKKNDTVFVSIAKDSVRESRSRSMISSTNIDSTKPFKELRKRAESHYLTSSSSLSDSAKVVQQNEPFKSISPLNIIPSADKDKGSRQDLLALDNVFAQDRVILNNDALDTQLLDSALEAADDFLSSCSYADELSREFHSFVNAIQYLRILRNAVRVGKWWEALDSLRQLKSDDLLTQIPSIKNEVSVACTLVSEFCLITSLIELLQKVQWVGIPIGEIDNKLIDVQYLEEMAEACETVECPNERSRIVRRALFLLIDIRKAQKAGDWITVSTLLKSVFSEGIAKAINFTDLYRLEINRISVERDNHENIKSMKAAIADEAIPTTNGLIDVGKISVEKLSAAHSKAYQIPLDNRGKVFKCLFTMVEVLLKIRKNLIQKKWNEIVTLVPFLQETNESFLTLLENQDKLSSTLKKSSTLQRGTILSRSGSMSSEGDPKSERLSRRQSSRQSVVTGSSSPVISKKSGGFWETYADITHFILADIKAIQTHMAVTDLAESLNASLQSQFIRADQFGIIDKTLIGTSELRKAIDAKAKLESSNISLPSHILQMAKVADFIYQIRTLILEDDWQQINSLVEGTLNGEFGVMMESSRREIQVVRAELQNRWQYFSQLKAFLNRFNIFI